MASKIEHKQIVPQNLPPNVPVGARVSIMRPNLWSGSYGEVVKLDGDKHLVKIFGKNGETFHAECYSIDLAQENDLWPEIQML